MSRKETIKIALALATLNHDWTEEPSIDEVVDAILVALDAVPLSDEAIETAVTEWFAGNPYERTYHERMRAAFHAAYEQENT